MKTVSQMFISYLHVLHNLHKHLCTDYMLLQRVQGKLCSELFLISHSFTSEGLFKHLVPEDSRPLFCFRQIVKTGCQPQKNPAPLWSATRPLPSPCSQTHIRRKFLSLTICTLSPIS